MNRCWQGPRHWLTSQEKEVAVMVHGWYPCSSTTDFQYGGRKGFGKYDSVNPACPITTCTGPPWEPSARFGWQVPLYTGHLEPKKRIHQLSLDMVLSAYCAEQLCMVMGASRPLVDVVVSMPRQVHCMPEEQLSWCTAGLAQIKAAEVRAPTSSTDVWRTLVFEQKELQRVAQALCHRDNAGAT